MATLKEAIQDAVARGDARKAARIASRFATYKDGLSFAQACTGIEPAAWDALMYEADEADSREE